MKQPLLCIGHRGAAGHEPENTLLSVEAGIVRGATWIEIDVYCVEGELVVIHDSTLERTTNGQGKVMESTLEYLRSLDAGKGQKIPLLTEVIAKVKGRAKLNIELKGGNTVKPISTLIRKSVQEEQMQFHDFLVSSFDHLLLRELKTIEHEIPVAPLIYGIPHDLAACGSELSAYAVSVSRKYISAELVADAHRRGLKVLVYTVNDMAEIESLHKLGTDGIFTDYPERCPK